MRILIVEDEKRLADTIAEILKNSNFTADAVYDGEDGLAYAQSGMYDAMILDVMLPKMDGFEVIRTLRAQKNPLPVMMLTARDDVASKVRGLDLGADDYLTKPFSPEELLARVRSMTRRQGEVVLDEMTFGDLVLQLTTCTLVCAEKSVHLSRTEFEVLRILMANEKNIVSKETLLVKIWGADSDAEDNNVEAYISFLRKKMFYLGSAVQIMSARKIGYYLTAGGAL